MPENNLSHDTENGKDNLMDSEKLKPMKAYAAVDTETGEIMAPTVSSIMEVTEIQRNSFYEGCPIYECVVTPKKKVKP